MKIMQIVDIRGRNQSSEVHLRSLDGIGGGAIAEIIPVDILELGKQIYETSIELERVKTSRLKT